MSTTLGFPWEVFVAPAAIDQASPEAPGLLTLEDPLPVIGLSDEPTKHGPMDNLANVDPQWAEESGEPASGVGAKNSPPRERQAAKGSAGALHDIGEE